MPKQKAVKLPASEFCAYSGQTLKGKWKKPAGVVDGVQYYFVPWAARRYEMKDGGILVRKLDNAVVTMHKNAAENKEVAPIIEERADPNYLTTRAYHKVLRADIKKAKADLKAAKKTKPVAEPTPAPMEPEKVIEAPDSSNDSDDDVVG